MKNFRGSALAAGVGTPESVPHELLGSSLRFYLVFKHRDCFIVMLTRLLGPANLDKTTLPAKKEIAKNLQFLSSITIPGN